MTLSLILIASILGSPHCAAMCGGFVAISSQGASPIKSQTAYHFGRLITYIFLGSLAGIIGSSVNEIGEKFGITQIATLIIAVLLIIMGISGLLHIKLNFFHGKIFYYIQKLQQKILPKRSRVIFFPLCVGLFSTLLPCGWLYTYVAVAASKASITSSMLAMLFFWIGTLPILITVGSLSNLFISPINKYVPLIASILMIVAGTISLASHLSHHDHSKHGSTSVDHSHHDHKSMHPSSPSYPIQTEGSN